MRPHVQAVRIGTCGRVDYRPAMDGPTAFERAVNALGHPVSAVLVEEGRPVVAGSLVGEPPRMRVAWLDPETFAVLGRAGCPPLVPSRPRPVVACAIAIGDPELVDRVLVARVSDGVAAIRPILAVEDEPTDVAADVGEVVLVRIPLGGAIVAVDAIDHIGEPVARLVGSGVADLRLSGGNVGGRLGSTHGMAAGFGPGQWVENLEEAEFAAGYRLVIPTWVPPGFVRGRPRIEPDIAYPFAPPAIVIAWSGPDDQRVLVRQAPAPLASPDSGGNLATPVEIGPFSGVLRGRWMPTLVWETPDRAFGVQVRRMDGGEEIALRVARSMVLL